MGENSKRADDRAFVAKHATRGSFEMAMASPDRYQPTDCYLVGAMAVHRSPEGARIWTISQVATGLALPPFWSPTLAGAVRLAVRVNKAVRWSMIKRGDRIGQARGLTRAKVRKLRAIAYADRPEVSA